MVNNKTKLIVCSVPMTEPAVRNRVEPFFNKFIDEGYEVKLLCPSDVENRLLVRNDVEVIEVDVPVRKIDNFIKRALNEIRASAIILSKAKTFHAANVLIVIPSMFLAFLAPFYMKKENTYLDVCDLSWEYLNDRKLTHFVSKRIFRLFFRLIINFFRGVIVTNPTEYIYIKSVKKDTSSLKIVPNGITKSQFDKLQNICAIPKNSRITITYVGNIGLAQHLDTFIGAAAKLPNVDFIIVGGGTDFDRIKSLVNSFAGKNLTLLGRVPWDKVKQYYDSTDILYAQLTPDYATAVPSKLYEYLATGRYIIYGGMAQAAERMSEFEHNQVIEPCNVDALVKAIQQFEQKAIKGILSESNIQKVRENYIREHTAMELVRMVNLDCTKNTRDSFS